MTEQPKEYIITGDEIDEIEKRFNDLIEKGTIPWEEDCLNTLDNIRSHPVSIPPEGAAPEPDYSRHNPRIELRKVCEQEAHDAAIRQDEREKVLTQFADLIHNESVRLSPAMVDMVYSYRVAQIITTYRNSKQERAP